MLAHVHVYTRPRSSKQGKQAKSKATSKQPNTQAHTRVGGIATSNKGETLGKRTHTRTHGRTEQQVNRGNEHKAQRARKVAISGHASAHYNHTPEATNAPTPTQPPKHNGQHQEHMEADQKQTEALQHNTNKPEAYTPNKLRIVSQSVRFENSSERAANRKHALSHTHLRKATRSHTYTSTQQNNREREHQPANRQTTTRVKNQPNIWTTIKPPLKHTEAPQHNKQSGSTPLHAKSRHEQNIAI